MWGDPQADPTDSDRNKMFHCQNVNPVMDMLMLLEPQIMVKRTLVTIRRGPVPPQDSH